MIDDLLFQEEHTMRARMANGVCLTCTRRAGNYFEATVQLRSSARRLSEDEFNRLRATLDDVLDKLSDDPMFFITNEGPVTGGYDVVLGSKGLARAWGDTSSTNTAAWSWRPIQRSAGKTAWTTRLTLLYRKPGYEIGDVVLEKPHLAPLIVDQRRCHHGTGGSKGADGATWRDLENAKVLAQKHELVEVDFINEDASVGEFLDPTTWAMDAVRLP